MPCFVYIIGSTDRTYCGWTTDLDGRLKAHNGGTGAKSTRGRNRVQHAAPARLADQTSYTGEPMNRLA